MSKIDHTKEFTDEILRAVFGSEGVRREVVARRADQQVAVCNLAYGRPRAIGVAVASHVERASLLRHDSPENVRDDHVEWLQTTAIVEGLFLHLRHAVASLATRLEFVEGPLAEQDG
jgi:hypothetical protein